MPSRAKAKGNSWERDVALHLSEVFKEHFMRVPTSGAYTGGSNAYRLNELTQEQKRIMSGDIITPPVLQYTKFECKNYADFQFHQLFNTNKQLEKWIDQSQDDGLWFLCIKVSRKLKLICFSNKFKFKYKNHLKYKNKYLICDYTDFFEDNREAIIEYNNQYRQTLCSG